MTFMVTAFYTIDTPYETEVQNLVKSLQDLNILYTIEGYENRGEWVENAGIKPEHIYDMMIKYPEYDILYVDADAIVRSYPELFDTFEGDIGVHYYKGKELLSGTIYLKNNHKMRSLVRYWIMEQHKNIRTWDQKTLTKVINDFKDELDLKIIDIPPSYVKIFNYDMCEEPPVIEHFQASRRFKSAVRKEIANKENMDMELTPELRAMGARKCIDGTFMIPRVARDVRKMLDSKYIPLKNENRWYLPIVGCSEISELLPIFEGESCYLIGKGKSLDYVTKEDFPIEEAPIVCINESIHKIETLDLPNPIFCIQHDAALKNTCKPKKGKIIVGYYASKHYDGDIYIYYPELLGLSRSSLTAECAIKIVIGLNTQQIILMCFDGSTTGNTDYAKCIGYPSSLKGAPNRFLDHKNRIERAIDGLDCRWVTPTAPESKTDDTPQQLLRNLEEHREHEGDQSSSASISNLDQF